MFTPRCFPLTSFFCRKAEQGGENDGREARRAEAAGAICPRSALREGLGALPLSSVAGYYMLLLSGNRPRRELKTA